MELRETLVLKRGDVAKLLSIDECIAAIEQAIVYEKAVANGNRNKVDFFRREK